MEISDKSPMWSGCLWVNTVAIILLPDNDLDKAVKHICPKEVILGKEYENSDLGHIIRTKNYLAKENKSIYFNAGEINYASSELLTISEGNLKNQREVKFAKALKRQQVTAEKLLNSSKKLENAKLIVIGD